MTKFARRIILYGLILFFALIAPSVIFYALGYDFDFEKRKLVLTGGFYASSYPKGAEIRLNNKLQGETPLFAKRLIPKKYQVKITKSGYQTWEKNLEIESMTVTEAKNVFLIPTNPVLSIVSSALSENFSLKELKMEPSSNDIYYFQKTSYILYRTDKNGSFNEQISLSPLSPGHDYRIISSENDKIAVLDEIGELYALDPSDKNFKKIASDVKQAHFSNDSSKLLYLNSSEIWIYYLRFNPNAREENNNYELITRLSQKINDAIWYGQASEQIVFATNDELKIAELDNRDKRNIFDIIKMKDIKEIGYNENDDKIYVVKNKELLTVDIAGQ